MRLIHLEKHALEVIRVYIFEDSLNKYTYFARTYTFIISQCTLKGQLRNSFKDPRWDLEKIGYCGL